MIEAIRNAWNLPDLRRRILYTLLILVIFRLAAHVPVPGVDHVALERLLSGTGGVTQVFNLLDLLSGGAVSNFSVMANGVYPYITANIIFSLLTPIIPALERIAQEGEAGRKKLERWQLLATIPLAALQAFGQARVFSAGAGSPVLPNFGFSPASNILPTISVLITMTAGTMFAIWLSELITEQGIGNGMSLIIFGGIVSGVPQRLAQMWVTAEAQSGIWMAILDVVIFLALTAIMMFVIVVVEGGERRIPVQYGKRVRGTRVYGGGSTHIPLRVNTAGMIPLIFAQSILTFPAVIAQFFAGSSNAAVAELATGVMAFFGGGSEVWYLSLLYALIFFLAVVGFTYFYTDIMVQQQDLPGNLQRQGGFLPGIRPGKRTADYINNVYRRITLVGALFLGGVAVLPLLVDMVLKTNVLLITSNGLLIVVGTVIDTMRQLEAQLLMRHYEGFIR